jgi:hypothetical protein
MELKKVSHTFSTNIIVTGDPIIDVYGGKEFPGGALNVVENISFFTTNLIKITPLEDLIKYFYPKKTSTYNHYPSLSKDISGTTVVCSDYNKGFLSSTDSRIYADLLIVDSKYNTISKKLLLNSKIKILKKTHTDPYDFNLFKYFDYILITNHNKAICVYDNKLNLIHITFPRPVKSKNPSGAGDVFVATLAYLLHETFDNLNLPVLFKAVDSAALLASLSTQTPHTSSLKDLNVYY